MTSAAFPSFQYSTEGAVLLAKAVLANYIVRIYRLDKKNPRHLVGVVEEVGVKGKKAFANYDELWDILISSKSMKRDGKMRIKGRVDLCDIIPEKGGKDENH